jgi:hypothetical protein
MLAFGLGAHDLIQRKKECWVIEVEKKEEDGIEPTNGRKLSGGFFLFYDIEVKTQSVRRP